MNHQISPPSRVNYLPALLIGILSLGLLALLCLIVFGGLAYLRGNSPLPATPTRAPTEPPVFTSTAEALPSSTPSIMPTLTATSTATFVLNTPTVLPTRTNTPLPSPTKTRTPIPSPTKTRTPAPSATPSAAVYHDTNYGIDYDAWVGVTNNKALGNGMRCSGRKDEVLAFDVVKNTLTLSLFFQRGPNQGKVKILVDGAAVETLDLYKNSAQYRYEWKYAFPNPKSEHQVKLVVLREKHNASAGYQVCFDGFMFNKKFADDSHRGIRYGAWAGASNARALAGEYRIASVPNSTLAFQIQGNVFEWITARGPNYGQADIYVDGIFAMAVDLYFPSQQWGEIVRVQNLGNGKHAIEIVVLGTRHPASSGDGIVFDGFQIPWR